MTRAAPLLASVALLISCTSVPNSHPDRSSDPEPVIDRRIEVEIIDDRGEPAGAGRLLCFPALAGLESPRELARRIGGSSAHPVAARGRATIPADTATAFFLGADASWPVAWHEGPISTRAGTSILRLIRLVRFADLAVVDEAGRPLDAIVRPMSDGEFPRPIPFGTPKAEGRVTDEEGRVRLSSPWWPDRGLWLQVTSAGRAPRVVEIRTSTPGHGGADAERRLVLERRRDASTFAVDDRSGRIVRPDLVRFRPAPPEGGDPLPEGHQLIEIGEDGRFTLPIGSRRPFRLEALAEGYEPWIDEGARIETLEIRLKPRR